MTHGPYPAPPPGFEPITSAPSDPGKLILAVSLDRLGELYDSWTMTPYIAWWSPGGEFAGPGWAREVHGANRHITHVAHPTHWLPGLDLGYREHRRP